MTADDAHTTDGARAAAGRDELGEWVAAFLASPGSDNAELGETLTQGQVWLGPVEVPLDQLHRLAGPEDHPVMEPVPDDWWRADVDDLARKLADGREPPPVIATHRDDHLVLEDGNHRVEALRRAGIDRTWTIVGFDDAAARDRFVARSEDAPL